MPFKPFKKGAKKGAPPARKTSKRGGIAEALDKARSQPMKGSRIKPKQMPMIDETDHDADDMAGC